MGRSRYRSLLLSQSAHGPGVIHRNTTVSDPTNILTKLIFITPRPLLNQQPVCDSFIPCGNAAKRICLCELRVRAVEWVTDGPLDQRRSASADQRLHLLWQEGAQAMLGESGVQRARRIVGRINQSAVEIGKKLASLGGLLPGVGEQSLDELVFE